MISWLKETTDPEHSHSCFGYYGNSEIPGRARPEPIGHIIDYSNVKRGRYLRGIEIYLKTHTKADLVEILL
jgi:hypothetical protein